MPGNEIIPCHSDDLLDEYFLLRADGFSPDRICALWGVQRETLRRALARQGVESPLAKTRPA